METMTCPSCTRPRTAADARGLAWSSIHGPTGAVSWMCPECTRAQIPAIEALLSTIVLDAAGGGVGRPAGGQRQYAERNAGNVGSTPGASGKRSRSAVATRSPSSAVASRPPLSAATAIWRQ